MPKFQDLCDDDFASGTSPSAETTNVPFFGSIVLNTNFRSPGVRIFISHRWQTPSHPDDDGTVRTEILTHLGDDALIWYDYSCLPQSPRTPAEQAAFINGLNRIPLIICSSWFYVVGRKLKEYSHRAWCQFEVLSVLTKGWIPKKDELNSKTIVLIKKSILHNHFIHG
jgi:hypothetical protein